MVIPGAGRRRGESEGGTWGSDSVTVEWTVALERGVVHDGSAGCLHPLEHILQNWQLSNNS